MKDASPLFTLQANIARFETLCYNNHVRPDGCV